MSAQATCRLPTDALQPRVAQQVIWQPLRWRNPPAAHGRRSKQLR